MARGQTFPFAPFLVDGRPARPPFDGVAAGVRRLAVTAHAFRRRRPLVAVGRAAVRASARGWPAGASSRWSRPAGSTAPARGPSAFFDLLHAGHESVALDFEREPGGGALRRLVDTADVVIESSRRAPSPNSASTPHEVARPPPGAHLGLDHRLRPVRPVGRRVAFGDDAAAAAGLVAMSDGGPVFCADAVADPWPVSTRRSARCASMLDGGGHLVDVALREAAGHLLASVPRRQSHDRAADTDAMPPGASERHRRPADGPPGERARRPRSVRTPTLCSPSWACR